jgi:hypothetical protein
LHQVTKSCLVKRKSPTSAWRRSLSSTRRTTEDRCGAWYRKPAVADAVAAAAVEAAEDAAAAAVADAAVAAEAAACHGALAACARLIRVPTTLTNARRHGRVRRVRPGQFMSSRRSSKCVDGRTRMTAERIFHPVENGRRARWTGKLRQSKIMPLQRRSGVASNMRVMTE